MHSKYNQYSPVCFSYFIKKQSQNVQQNGLLFLSLVTLETRAWALVADDRALDETGLPAVGGNHHRLGRLGLDGHPRLAVGLNQGVDREALGLHGDPLGVQLHAGKTNINTHSSVPGKKVFLLKTINYIGQTDAGLLRRALFGLLSWILYFTVRQYYDYFCLLSTEAFFWYGWPNN